MTYEEIKKKAISRMFKDDVTVEALAQAVIELNNDLAADDNVFSLALDCLQARLTESAFIEFLDNLE